MPSVKTCVLAIGFAALAIGCGRRSGGGHVAPVSSITADKPPPTKATPTNEERVAAGAVTYAKYCALCHAPDATGYAADHAPSLVTSTFLASATDEFLRRSIGEGRPGTAMAAYAKNRGGPLEPEEVASLIAFLRSHGPKPIAVPPLPAVGTAAWGEETYQSTCLRCHGTRENRGEAPHLANPVFLSVASDAFLRYAILNGRPGTDMKSFAGQLDEARVDDVVAYIRSWAAPPPAAPRPPPPPEIPLGPIVINPHGRSASFTAKDDRFVPADDVKKALDAKQKLVIIDARAASDWLAMHIPGSISLPYYQLDRIAKLPNDGTWIIAYCACPHHASGVVVDELKKRGFKHAAILDEGILEWHRRSYPVTGNAVPPAIGSAAPATSAPPHVLARPPRP